MQKKMHNYVLKKKIKKNKGMTLNTVLTPTHRQKPAHKSPTAAGMRKYNRSVKAKKKASEERLNKVVRTSRLSKSP
jgi:hypothetical protein